MELEGIVGMRQFFEREGILKECTKNEFFIQQGQHHSHIAFILKGGFRYLGYSSEGKEQIVGYSFENDFVVDYATFQIQEPPIIDAQSIKKSTILILPCDKLNTYFKNCGIPDLRSKVAETLLNDLVTRLLSMYCDSPEERYTKLIARSPEILSLVSLKEIASLIKVTPETLSRIRRKLKSLDLNQEF
ncbi:CRP-like cAMP-binding protein [Sunxiuqinia elliptica]|uniref:CRP-like cAMP-binding protein n=2 Tax=Sunxiuqinia elliptica TaxID=655355 RepID=A0A4V3BXI1_9BACT|nr:CRP-like cAMP-binding protein [Sunxiuqinia elliptica]TDO56389.1 CRP-like cAMP-binding protein [Sunxiuqinia elliptica]